MRAVVMLIVLLASLMPSPAAAAVCDFKLGFKAIADQIPAVVGQCLEDEHPNSANGDALQKTSGGLLVWRKDDNVTASGWKGCDQLAETCLRVAHDRLAVAGEQDVDLELGERRNAVAEPGRIVEHLLAEER